MTVTQVFAGGKWLPAGSSLPGDLPNFDYEKHAAKGLIEDTEGDEIRNPSAQVEAPESVADIDTLRQQLADAQRERDAMTAGHKALGEEVGKMRDAFAAEKDRLIESAQSLAGNVQAQEKAILDLTAERDTLITQLTESQARPLLPEDARERLIKVNGVAEKLAGTILDALTAPATAE